MRTRAVVRVMAAATLALVCGGFLQVAPAGAASGVPVDPSAKGFIGLCDSHNHNVSGGDIHTTPFIWKAVSAFAPPSSFRGSGQNAVLNIYQPRPGVDPGDWSGDQLTGATYYTTKSAPSVQATLKDIPLSVVVNEFPPEVNGLYELRMYFGKSNVGVYSTTYPATFIRVVGSRWSVVTGGMVNCAASSGQAAEVLYGGVSRKAAYGSATPQPASGKPSSSRTHGSSSTDASVSQSPVSETSGATPPGGSASGSSSSSAAWWVAAIAVVLAAAAGLAWLRARSRSTTNK